MLRPKHQLKLLKQKKQSQIQNDRLLSANLLEQRVKTLEKKYDWVLTILVYNKQQSVLVYLLIIG